MAERKLKIDKVKTFGGRIERDCVHFDGADDTANVLLIDWHGRRITIIDNIDPDTDIMQEHRNEPELSILYDPCENVTRDIEITGSDMETITWPSDGEGDDKYSEVTEQYRCKDVAIGLEIARKNAKAYREGENHHA